MKASKSINSLVGNNNHNFNSHQQMTNNGNSSSRSVVGDSGATMNGQSQDGPTSPICRCRVMYLGSSVPHITKDGLQGIQEPLRELYPDKASLASGNAGIDSWLSVWSNGILVENVDETGREVKRFFKIEALHYCAAVKFVPQLQQQQSQQSGSYSTMNNGNLPKFLPLDSPHARNQQANLNPPIFASILRRTTGIKVLECHAFICKREAAANALVRCCFHAYADTMYAKQLIEIHSSGSKAPNNAYSSATTKSSKLSNGFAKQPMASRRSKSIAALNDSEAKDQETWTPSESGDYNTDVSSHTQDVNYQQSSQQVLRRKSMNEHYANCDNQPIVATRQHQMAPTNNNQLQRQHKSLSKSMHHLNQDSSGVSHDLNDQASGIWPHQIPQVPQHQPFYNPHAARVPSYPPQSLIDAANSGGTLKSIKSMATTSIASTLLRSKKHAKAMSMAQLNHDKITSFHQPHLNGGGQTIAGPMMMPPVPSMFMQRPIINGSQTMKAPSRSMVPMMGAPMNFEAMTPKEMKKLLKKSAKYGIDPKKFSENNLPMFPPMRPPVPPMHPSQASGINLPYSKSGTMISQSVYSMDIHGGDIPDMASIQSFHMNRSGTMPPLDCGPMEPQPLKPILVKPNPEFLKSKAGKKWLKQQKEFKKLLPPHLEGLPIVFGPPPIEALEPATMPNNSHHALPPTFIPSPHQPGLPIMDASGYYNPHPFYGPSGRASVASTLMRYSPHSQLHHSNGHESLNGMGPPHPEYMHLPGQSIYSQNGMVPPPMVHAPAEYMSDNSSAAFGASHMNDQAYMMNGSRHIQKRNQMVEQSVISLGDENDHEDDEEEDGVENNHGVDCRQNGYYNDVNSHQSQQPEPRSSKSNSKTAYKDYNDEHINNNYIENESRQQHQDYEQVGGQYTDDQSSYSSGIYRRGHINERAFSHSIRQEHRNNNGSQNFEPEYSNEPIHDNRRNHHNSQSADRECHLDENQRILSSNIYQNTRDQQNIYNYHQAAVEQQTIPVNELTARLENQLNMKSFANSRIKSHM